MVLSQISIKRPVLATMMSLLLVLFGVIGLQRLPVRELPDIDPPIVSVTTIYPGASAAVVETEVTERLEEAINSIEGIKTLTSQSREQLSTVTVEFELSRDVDLAAQDVRDRVSRVRGALPDDIDEPVVAKQDADANPIMWIGVNSDRYTPVELTTIAEKQIKNRLETIKGVSSIRIGGEKRFAIRLWLDSAKLAARQLTIIDVQNALRAQNVELPSGRVENLDREMTIQTLGELKTADEFNRLVLKNDGATIVRLRDVGEARDGVEDERTIARNNGNPCIFLGIVKQSKANTVQVADDAKAELEKLKPSLPAGINMAINYDESIYVNRAITEVWETLVVAFGLVIIVIYLFLRDLRSTLIPAVVIPVSIVATFAIMHMLGHSVNILTMLALVLAIGVVVDDAIVVLENIYRHIEAGMKPMAAAKKAMDEIGFAIIAITVALVAVFIPLTFLQSATGQLFSEFAVAVAGSVVISAFVALTLTPMMAARVLKPVDHRHDNFVLRAFEGVLNFFQRIYAAALGWSLKHRFLVVLVGLGSMWLMVVAYNKLEKEFLPEEDKGRLLCIVFGPEGSTSEYTDRIMMELEGILQTVPEVEAYGAIVAPGFTGPGLANNGIGFVRLKDGERRSVQEVVNAPGGIRSQFFANIEGAIAIPQIPKSIGRGFGAPFQLVIKAPDLEQLDKYVTSLLTKLRKTDYLQNARTSYEINKPELKLDIDRDRAAALGVSIADISRTLQVLYGGLDLSKIKKDGKEYDVIAQLERESRLTPQTLEQLYVRNNKNELIQLSSLVTRRVGAAPNAIEHYDRMRSATISASIVNVPLGTAMERVEKIVEEDLPEGFLSTWAGESRDLREAGSQIWWVLGIALIIVYMVLASQFESMVHPFTVMLAVPLAGVGAMGGLWLMDWLGKSGIITPLPAMNINLFSQIGIILLVGLVTKNSILLVEFANQECEAGKNPLEAMLEAGKVRLRPILMTAFSTIAGILPIAIGFGAGAESRRPMGVAVIGGMLTSTFLTLLVIPVVYTLLSDVTAWLKRRFFKHETTGGTEELQEVTGK